MANPLEKEIETFHKLLPSLLADEGKFAVIHGDKLIGTFGIYEDALRRGYEVCGLHSFLVKKIASFETPMNFTRRLTPCHT